MLAACVVGLVFNALGTVHSVDNFTQFRSGRPLKVIAVNQDKVLYRCSEINVFIGHLIIPAELVNRDSAERGEKSVL